MDEAKYDIFVEQAKAKARAIEHEAEILLENTKTKTKEMELQAQNELEKQKLELEKEYETKLNEILKKEEEIEELIQKQLDESLKLEQEKRDFEKEKIVIQKLKETYNQKIKLLQEKLENVAGLTKDEAKEILLNSVKEDLKEDVAHLTRKIIKEAESDAKKKANYIIAQATTRYAGEFAGERLINVVPIGDDEMKGRIIGKEGKNIKTLEMVTGCDIIIDDTPGAITVSSFNIYRRQIAVETIKRLVEDGRIQPADRPNKTDRRTIETISSKIRIPKMSSVSRLISLL
jgi:ribonuclease Y